VKKILIIDDSVTVRLYHKQILAKNGYDCDEAENGMEALEKAAQSNYDLFLVDINMPILDGYSFVKRYRSEYGYDAQIIMISTEAEKADITLAYESGANLYQVKPIGISDLTFSVDFLIESN
jgi:two-component system chemotaxis response regulator CheY